jgi:3-hydroxyisobutyrate dehydrogenase-like beta-hydroxyacid dehydrogenase
VCRQCRQLVNLEEILMDVGFIGLGRMGQAMARNLLKAGFRVIVFNRTRRRAEELRDEGAEVADSPGAACKGEVVITMLADDDAVEEVVLGSGRVIGAPREDAVHLSMSTITVALSEELTEARRTVGQHFVAAPVSGDRKPPPRQSFSSSPPAERDRSTAVNRCSTRSGKRHSRSGTCPPKSGVGPQHFLEILTGSLFAARVYETYGELIVSERYQPAGLRMSLGLKDVRSLLAVAEAENVPMPVASLVRDHFISGIARGKADLDWSALARVAAENAGL